MISAFLDALGANEAAADRGSMIFSENRFPLFRIMLYVIFLTEERRLLS
jgi:hypothetical protein